MATLKQRRKEVRDGIKARLEEIKKGREVLCMFMQGCTSDDAYRGYSRQLSDLNAEEARLKREYKVVNQAVR